MNWTAEHVFDEKITVATTNATATAISGVGGSTSGIGVAGTAQVTSAGNGVVGLALGTGHGVAGAAVDASANGGNFVNNTNSATALKGTSTGTSSFGVWGEGKGAGVKGLGTSGGNGGRFTGDNGAAGIEATGGATSGIGGIFTGRTAAGVYATRDDSTTLPVITADGSIDLDGASYPAASTALKDKLTVNTVAKIWGCLEITSSSTIVVSEGQNISSVTYTANVIIVNFAQNMAGTGYSVLHQYDDDANHPSYVSARAVGSIQFAFANPDGSAPDLSPPASGYFTFEIKGAM